MRPLTRETIEATWDEICNLDQVACNEIVQRFSRKQPFLTVYLFAQDEQFGGQDEEAPMISLALMIWKLLASGSSPQLSDRAIEKAEAKNIRFLKRLDAGPELREKAAISGLMTTYNQAALLGFCLEILMSGYEDAPEMVPENIGLQLLTLKTMIDCLDK